MFKYLIQFLFFTVSCFAQKPTLVFVHGATGGGWNWKQTADLMEKKGYKTYRATLTGLGEREHLASPEIGLRTHILDVVNLLNYEELQNVVLIGHSYGGMVITGVADSLKSKIKALVYIDALVPVNGESTFGDEIPEASKEGYFEPSWIVKSNMPGDRKQSMKSLTDKIVLKNKAGNGLKVFYLLTADKVTEPEKDDFFGYYRKAKTNKWQTQIMESNHNPQNSKRLELVGIIEGFLKTLK